MPRGIGGSLRTNAGVTGESGGDGASDIPRSWPTGSPPPGAREAAIAWLQAETGLESAGAEAIVDYVEETLALLGTVPTQHRVVAERFFDEAGGMQLVLHSPFGGRINRAWGLSLRKRFCVTFDFELQAAATDDGIVISLGEQHSFPLDSVFQMVRPVALEADLTQAALQSPMFTNRWRWNASRALALLRHEHGRRVPMNLQRMRAEDLLAAVFPANVACQDNRTGPIVPPDHPLVNETIDNCLHEAMDVDGLRDILLDIERGVIETVAVETPAPSAMSHEILNANPYAFLDDAPLEERRARAVALRRTDPGLAGGIGALDPEAIAVVRSQAWPDVRDAEELHDALLTLGILPLRDLGEWQAFKDELVAAGRASVASWTSDEGAPPTIATLSEAKGLPGDASPAAQDDSRIATLSEANGCSGDASPAAQDDSRHRALVAAERVNMVRTVCSEVRLDPPIAQPAGVRDLDRDDAVGHIVQGWLEAVGPTTAAALADRIGLCTGDVDMALAALEGRGAVLRGTFTRRVPSSEFRVPSSLRSERGTRNQEPGTRNSQIAVEWCERRLLARIHRLTLGRLRQEIEPVSVADFIRFLFRWHHLAPGSQLHGKEGVAAIIRQLQGLELPAPAWEASVLPGRIAGYNPADLEQLCLAGVVAWGRLSRRPAESSSEFPVPTSDRVRPRSPTRIPERGTRNSRRRRQGPGRQAPLAFLLRDDLPIFLSPSSPAGESWERKEDPASSPQEGGESPSSNGLSREAGDVADYLARRGASFLSEIARGTRQVPAAVEDALWELVAHGLVTGDGIAGLRVLLQPESKRLRSRPHLRSLPGGRASQRTMPVGRWSLWGTMDVEPPTPDERIERLAWQFLRRYGLVFRDLLAREGQAPPWRALLPVYRRLEARGEIRGGRFVAGLVGEQYALPEAVDALRSVRRAQPSGEIVLVASSDPLNLVGIITPGSRVSPFSNQVIAHRDGIPVEIGPLGAIRSRLQLPKPVQAG